jgi:plastocyanin domain-containing protein
MTTGQILVLLGGIGAIAWINWYFFFAERRAASAVQSAVGVQEIAITVKGGYEPATVRVTEGRPVRLIFDRQETSSCSEEVVMPDFGVRKFLAPFRRTTVELVPRAPGTFDFTCGMGMLHGKMIVEPAR